jgi:AcrR family transcriptional regulator
MADGGKAQGIRREIRLTEERIHATALTLIDADGIDALSMRKLAAALDVNPMSLYHHVANKAALLDGVVRLVTAELRLPLPSDGPWQSRLRQLADAFRVLTHAHRELILHAFTSPDFIRRESILWRTLRGILQDAGVPDDDLDPVAAVLAGLVGGLLLTEVNAVLDRFPGPPGGDHPFDIAVQMLIAGLEARVGAAGRPSAAH